MTLADRIRQYLLLGLKSNAEIAVLLNCSADYVRAVKQRTDKTGEGCNSPADARYLATNPEYAARRRVASRKRNYWRWHHDPAYRKAKLAGFKKRYREDPVFRERECARRRAAYWKAKEEARP